MVKGKQLQSFKDVKVDQWIYVNWWDDPYKLLPVRKKYKGYIIVETPNGGLLEVDNPKACWEAIEQ